MRKEMDKEVYQELIQRFYKEQYGEDEDEEDKPIVTNYDNIIDSMKAKIEGRKNIPKFINPDLTNVPSSQLKSLIEKSMIIKIGEFSVNLRRENKDGYTMYSADVQENTYTITGFGHRMKKAVSIDFKKDIRFEGFDSNLVEKITLYQWNHKLTLDDVVDLVKWLRAVIKLAAFI